MSLPPVEIARSIVRHRGLLLALTLRELKARYRGSILGFLWSLVQPLLLLGVYTFVFGTVFQPRAAGADPYALFLVCGLFPWIWLATAVTEEPLRSRPPPVSSVAPFSRPSCCRSSPSSRTSSTCSSPCRSSRWGSASPGRRDTR
ncbi:MAG: ABC transporter permease [Thermoanaerobaculia bacterium]